MVIDRQRPLSVGEVARRSGVAVSTVHFYEREGLIAGWRSGGNQRRYGRDVLRRIAVIRIAQRTGIPLGQVEAALAAMPNERTPTGGDWRKLSEQWRGELDSRIAQLTKLRDRLDGCIGCGCLSVTACPLRNPDDVLAKQGPGPHYLEA